MGIKKTGYWGNVTWQIELSCGHVEVRKRRPPGTKAGCTRCMRERDGGTDSFLDPSEVDDWLMAESEIDDVARRLSNRLGVPQDLVQVLPMDGGFSATLVLPPSVVERLLR